MGEWQEIWSNEGARRLWGVPDRQVVALADAWSADGTIKRVLDLGCGVGRHALCLARKGFEVYGSDHSEAGIEACKQWLVAEGLNAQVWCSEPEEIPYSDGFFDAVIAFNSIYHGTEERVAAAMRLIHAKLRPGGRAFVTLLSRKSRMYGRGQAIGPNTFVSDGMFHQLFANGGERGVPHHFSSQDEVERFFTGFKIESLLHEELHLPSARQGGDALTWFKIPGAYFWRVVAVRE